jgi:hypothetical protein
MNKRLCRILDKRLSWVLYRRLHRMLDRILNRGFNRRLYRILNRRSNRRLDRVLNRRSNRRLDGVLNRGFDWILNRRSNGRPNGALNRRSNRRFLYGRSNEVLRWSLNGLGMMNLRSRSGRSRSKTGSTLLHNAISEGKESKDCENG